MDKQLGFLLEIGRRLDSAAIPYMITGSVALSAYAAPRMTRDIDIVVEIGLDDVDRIVGLFEQDCYIDRDAVSRAIHDCGIFNVIHDETIIKAAGAPLAIDGGPGSGDVVTFDASATQSYFELVNFTWTFVFEGSPIELYGVQPTFQFRALGLYEVTLNVTDAVGRYETDTFWILLVDLWIPEFGGASVHLTVAASLALILAVRHRRRS